MRGAIDLRGLPLVFFFSLAAAFAVGGALGIAVLMCVAGAATLRPSVLREAVEKRPAIIGLLLAFTAWSAASSLWSPYPAGPQALKLITLVSFGIAFVAAATRDATMRRLTAAGGLATVLVLIPLLGIEAIWTMPLNRAAQPDVELGDLGRNVSRGAAFLVALTWGAVGGLIVLGGVIRTLTALLVLAASAALAFQFGQQANALAYLTGLAAFTAALLAPRLALLGVSGALAVWMLAAPFVTPLLLSNQRLLDALPLSWAARAGIWSYVSARIVEQPWIGHGLEASRTVTERIQVRDLNAHAIPVHPHSASLQIWFETGAVGAVLAAATIWLGGLWLARAFAHNRAGAAAACATLAAFGVIANVSFGVWAEWWVATMFVAAAIVGANRRVTAR